MRIIFKTKVAEYLGHAVIQYVELYPEKNTLFFAFFSVTLQPNTDHGLIIILDVSTSHDAPQLVGLLLISDQLD
jgi:hypothetical protein